MALVFAEVWPDVAAGTMQNANVDSRRGAYVRGVLEGEAKVVTMSHDGTDSGTGLLGDYPGIPWAMVAGPDGQWTPMGGYGPIVDYSQGAAVASAKDLFFVLLERAGFSGRITVYNGGPDSGGFANLQGRGRAFYAFYLGS